MATTGLNISLNSDGTEPQVLELSLRVGSVVVVVDDEGVSITLRSKNGSRLIGSWASYEEIGEGKLGEEESELSES